ncbi:MAG: APC family permease [Tissierellia bacterium]|nr:APC family permease [Tissierellia bacterium]
MNRDFFMLGFGSMVGVGWAVSSNHWLAQAGGPLAAFLGFLLGTLLLLPIGLSHGELMSSMPVSGGVMVYAYRAYNTFISFIGSWFVALAYLTILPWEAIYINNILTRLFPFLRGGTPLYHVMGSPIYLKTVLMGTFFALGLFFINLKGSKLAGKIQTALSYVIILCGAAVIIFSFLKFDMDNILPLYKNIGIGTHQHLYSGILSMVVLVPFFMAGFDTIPQSIEEKSDKITTKSVSRTLILSIVAAGIFYALIIISTAGISPWTSYALEEAPAMANRLQSVYGGSLGSVLYYVIMIGTLSGLFSTWNGMFMASARLLESMGRSGLLPKFFKKSHKKYKTPVGASVFCFVAAAAGPLVGFAVIDSLTSLGSVAFVLGWFITCLSALKLRKNEKNLKRPFDIFGGIHTIRLSVVISLLIVLLTFIPGQPAFMGRLSLILFFIWLALGFVFYYFTNFGERGISERMRRRILFPKNLVQENK